MKYKTIILVFLYLMASACSEQNNISNEYQKNTTKITPSVKNADDDLNIRFLTYEDNVDPANWLIYQVTGQKASSHTYSEDINRLLTSLDRNYTEDKRMIANRVMQTFSLLKENDLDVELKLFMEDVEKIPSEGTMTVFGSYCQHYFNLRFQGVSHENAIQTMIDERIQANAR